MDHDAKVVEFATCGQETVATDEIATNRNEENTKIQLAELQFVEQNLNAMKQGTPFAHKRRKLGW